MPLAECDVDEERCFNKPCSAAGNLCYDHCGPASDPSLRQCEFVSNRTRLRCKNRRRSAALDCRGFCDDHAPFLARLKRSSAKQRAVLDPGYRENAGLEEELRRFGTSEAELKRLDLTGNSIPEDNDDDLIESLDWPFVQESSCCDARLLDSDDNLLRNAEWYIQDELSQQNTSAAERHKHTLDSYRSLLADKFRRLCATNLDTIGAVKNGGLDGVSNGSKRMKRELKARRRYGRTVKTKRVLQLIENAQAASKAERRSSDGCEHFTTVKRRKLAPTSVLSKVEENGNSVESAVEAAVKDVIDWVVSAADTTEREYCRAKRVPMSDFCLKHILEDQQHLFSKCEQCGETDLMLGGKLCHRHAVVQSPLFAPLASPKPVCRPSRSGSLQDGPYQRPTFIRSIPPQHITSTPEYNRRKPMKVEIRRTRVQKEGWAPAASPPPTYDLLASDSDTEDEFEGRTVVIDEDDEIDWLAYMEESQRFQEAYAKLRAKAEEEFGTAVPFMPSSMLAMENGSSRESFDAMDDYEPADYVVAKQQAAPKSKKLPEPGCARVRPFVGKDGRTDGNVGGANRRNSVTILHQPPKHPDILVPLNTSFGQSLTVARKPSTIAVDRRPNGTNYVRAQAVSLSEGESTVPSAELQPAAVGHVPIPQRAHAVPTTSNGSPMAEHRPMTVVRKIPGTTYLHQPVAGEPPPRLQPQARVGTFVSAEDSHAVTGTHILIGQNRLPQAGVAWNDAGKPRGRPLMQRGIYDEQGYHLAASPPNAARNVARRVIAPATRRPPQTLATTQNGTGQIHAVAMPALKAGRLVASPNAAWQAGHTVRVITTTRYLPSPRDHRSPSNGSGRSHRIEDHGEMRGEALILRNPGPLKNGPKGRPAVARREPMRNPNGFQAPVNVPRTLRSPPRVYRSAPTDDPEWPMDIDEPTVVATPTYLKTSKPPVGLHMLANAATAQVPTDTEPQPPVPALPTPTKSIAEPGRLVSAGLEEEEED